MKIIMLTATLALAAAGAAPQSVNVKKTAVVEKKQGTEIVMAKPGDFYMEWAGADCLTDEPEEVFVTDEAQWKKLWSEKIDAEPPVLDFSKYSAAAVFAGMKNTGGYDVKFAKPAASKVKKILRYKITEPKKSDLVIEMLTRPYRVIAFEKDGLAVSFEKITAAGKNKK